MQAENKHQKNNLTTKTTPTTTPEAVVTTTPITTTAETVIATVTEINQSNGRASEENRGGVLEKQSRQDTNKSGTISKQISSQSVSSSVADLDKQQDEISTELSKAISSSTQRNNNKFSGRALTEVYSDEDDEGDDDDNEIERIGFSNRHRFNRSMYHSRTVSAVDTESEIVYDDDEDDDGDDYQIGDNDEDINENSVRFRPTAKRVGIVSNFWQPGTISRQSSPPGFITMDSTVDNSMTRSHNSNPHLANIGSKYSNLSYWRARRVIFYKNGDPFFPGLEIRFKPGRDIVSLEALLDKLSLRLDLPRGARYIFSMDGERKLDLDELEDGASYVVSSFKTFKPAIYGKKNGIWYATASNQTWNRSSNPNSILNNSNRKSMIETDITNMSNTNSIKSGSGRVIRIINDVDHTIQCRILLNLRTSQPFEEVVEDLGQVLKIAGANKMYTVSGQEVRGFSQLRNEFMDMDTFYIGIGTVMQASPPMRRSRSKTNLASASEAISSTSSNVAGKQRRARSKSRPRILFAPENEIIRSNSAVANDFTVVDVMKDEPIKISIRGMRRTFYPPLHHPPIDSTAPYKKLSLDWVYGYRGIDTKRNLWVLSTGELLYYVAAVAIMYDRDEETQRHYIGHTEDITCMDLHPSREMVVSGQKSGRSRKTQGHIRIWSTETLQTLYIFGMGDFELGVAAVAFSYLNGGSYVLTAELGKEAILSVWHWQWGHLLGKVATLQEEIYGAAFHPLDDNLLITFGRSALSFWNRRKDGFFERTDIIKPPSRTSVTCVQFEPEGDVVTGDSDGFITVYSVDSDGTYFVRMEYEAHNKGVSALIMLSEGTLLSGGEKDRRISAWDSLQNYKRITDCKLPDMVGSVRNIYPQRPGRNDGNIYVGTTKNVILEGSLQRRFNPIIMGHSRQLWGLAVHPDDELFATAGHDKYVNLWKKHKQVWSTMVNFECISLAFHPFGYALAVGTIEGHLLIMNTETGSNSTTVRICGSPLNCIGYNPVGDMISIASQNGSIYLFSVSRDGFIYKKVNKMRGTQPLIQLDWSTDSCFLQTVTADYDLSFWDVKSLSPEKSAIAMKDVKWYTYNSMLGFSVAGMWNNWFYAVTALITTANRSFAHDLLVSGDSEGYLRLFRFPCISTKSEHHEQKVYSGPVVCSRFFFNDRFVASVGGSDAALMLWELITE